MTSVPDIAAMLRADADALARKLLPGGRYQNGAREWRVNGRNSPTGDAISVHVAHGPKQGVCGFWNDARKGGDMLDLIGIVFGGSSRDALDWAKGWLGLDQFTRPARAAQRIARIEDNVAADIDRQRRADAATRIWRETTPLCGAPAAYLISRGLDVSLVNGEVRAHPGLRHPDGGTFPALVARVANHLGRPLGIWRIFVKPDGSGKAPVETPRLGLGDIGGGAVPIGGVWPEIGVAEGIETALACRQIIHDATGHLFPVWPALSTSGMTGVLLPEEVRSSRIFADNDTVKFREIGGMTKIVPSPGMKAAMTLRDRLTAQGITATIEAPPTGLDWLDVLNARDAEWDKDDKRNFGSISVG